MPTECRRILQWFKVSLLKHFFCYSVCQNHARFLCRLIILAEAGSDDEIVALNNLKSLHCVPRQPYFSRFVEFLPENWTLNLANIERQGFTAVVVLDHQSIRFT